jgi:TIR domain
MSTVFVSYKREDEVRVAKLVRGLESANFTVWWDRGLPGGENWRERIQGALQSARCVIVVWTRESVGSSGDFVRDEAGDAKRRGILVPVRLDRVDPPLGFGEIQTVDLTHWNGRRADPFFNDLVAAVMAKLEGRPVPPARGPMKQLRRRMTYGSIASAIVSGGVAFGANLFGLQDRACTALLWPHLSDVCGAMGLGHRPSRSERVAWESNRERRETGSCTALVEHIGRFPEGAYRDEAAARLAARRVTQRDVWEPAQRRLALIVSQDGPASGSERAAQAAALTRGRPQAEHLCRGFAATTVYRLRTSAPDVQTWRCSPAGKGWVCGFDGEAICEVDERHIQEEEKCGS